MNTDNFFYKNLPKISVGIPTYNRANLLKRTIDSVVNQDYWNIEILVSDNASTDNTKEVCSYYLKNHGSLFKYFRNTKNNGPTGNFNKVLAEASGDFFMWLGDDDWLDTSYIRNCLIELLSDQTISMVSGEAKYYLEGQYVSNGKIINLLNDQWWFRVVSYYAKVSDNGMFYGLMHSAHIKQIKLNNIMGGDWLVVAGLSSIGKIKTIPGISVHRELGGATASYQQIASSLGLSKFHEIFPMLSIASSALTDILVVGKIYKSRSLGKRILLSSIVFLTILFKRFTNYYFIDLKLFKKTKKTNIHL